MYVHYLTYIDLRLIKSCVGPSARALASQIQPESTSSAGNTGTGIEDFIHEGLELENLRYVVDLDLMCAYYILISW